MTSLIPSHCMKKRKPERTTKKRRLGGMLALLLCIPLLVGCGRNIVFTMGDSENIVFRVGTRAATAEELRTVMQEIRDSYDAEDGAQIWEADPTLSDSVKAEGLRRLSRVKALCAYADSNGIELSEEERGEVASSLDEEYALAEKTYDVITQSVSMEISDEEARVARCESLTVLFDDPADREKERLLAGKILGEVSRGTSFEAAAQENGVQYDGELVVKRGELPVAVEEAAFRLKAGAVSDIIETEAGYRILRGITDFDERETALHREEILQAKRDAVFSETYDAFLETQDVFVNEAVLAGV